MKNEYDAFCVYQISCDTENCNYISICHLCVFLDDMCRPSLWHGCRVTVMANSIVTYICLANMDSNFMMIENIASMCFSFHLHTYVFCLRIKFRLYVVTYGYHTCHKTHHGKLCRYVFFSFWSRKAKCLWWQNFDLCIAQCFYKKSIISMTANLPFMYRPIFPQKHKCYMIANSQFMYRPIFLQKHKILRDSKFAFHVSSTILP
jgi:hypothetical protein